jgi:PadR family transcriptional regulator, regulatory protein PadR
MKNELLHGSLDVMILKTLSWGRMHGHGIGRWIEQQGGGAIKLEEGSLYPALYRLEGKGLIDAEWGLSEKNRKAKYYRLTPRGRATLRTHTTLWTEFTAAVASVLRATTGPENA